jgi:hypothetical protein
MRLTAITPIFYHLDTDLIELAGPTDRGDGLELIQSRGYTIVRFGLTDWGEHNAVIAVDNGSTYYLAVIDGI